MNHNLVWKCSNTKMGIVQHLDVMTCFIQQRQHHNEIKQYFEILANATLIFL